jgi:hypothetical protein
VNSLRNTLFAIYSSTHYHLHHIGAPPDSTENLQDPFGSGGESFVRYGLCPIDKHFDDDAKDLQILAYAKLNAYDQDTHGHFFVST